MSEVIEKTIDIDKILKGKMGKKVKFVPGFLVSWLKRLVHEDEVNKFLWESRHLSGTEWLTECVKYLKMDIEIVGMENLPDKNDGKLYTFVSNHPWADKTVWHLAPSSVPIMRASSDIWSTTCCSIFRV